MPLIERDKKYSWHPFTQSKTAEDPLPILRGEGAYLYTANGDKFFDGISSWWTILHGHSHPKIAEAIATQAKKLSHVMFADFTHEPAVDLAQKLIDNAPPGLTRVFYSDNGSTAVETALKMCFQYWHQTNPEKTVLFALKDGYHGDTFGAMAAGERSIFTKAFWPKLFDVVHVDTACISHCRDGFTESDLTQATLGAIETQLAPHARQFAGFIVEPLLQAAGGMKVWPRGFLKGISDLCKKYDGFLILDEVVTSFYRSTEHLFASQEEDVSPDLICVSKGLTSGTLPIGATLATEKIFQGFVHEKKERALLHGHTFTANPLGCAAALASFELLNNGVLAKRIAHEMLSYRDDFAILPGVKHVRTKGPNFIVEFDCNDPGYSSKSGEDIRKYCLARGLFIRPIGNVLYFMPPYCTTTDEIDWALTLIKEGIRRR